MPLSSPEHCNSDEDVEDIRSEPPPPDMNEVACETLAEELRLAQVIRLLEPGRGVRAVATKVFL